VYQANGWELPRFAHIPLIHGADGAKLSKRHGAVSVLEFREQGFLPEALCNYLLRLGWGHGDTEIISRDEAVALFDLDAVGRAASRMDYAKLMHLNAHYLRLADDDRLTADVVARLGVTDPVVIARVRALMPGLKERARTLVELAASANFLTLSVPLAFDAKAQALLTPQARALLDDVSQALAAGDFTAEAINDALRALAEASGRKLGQVAQPIRAALTGSTTSPPIDATLLALGRDEALLRIRHAVEA
jgi:glutamyl-tRNA synthetase